jgi:hypothetical protein
MGDTDHKIVEFHEREGRLNRRVAVAGIVATVSIGILSAVVTAHSEPVIKFLGGRAAGTAHGPSPHTSTPNPSPNTPSPTPVTIQLPAGQLLARVTS